MVDALVGRIGQFVLELVEAVAVQRGKYPLRLGSTMRMAFWKLSSSVRPMDITSLTDFMAEPICVETPWNLLMSQRGIFVTM